MKRKAGALLGIICAVSVAMCACGTSEDADDAKKTTSVVQTTEDTTSDALSEEVYDETTSDKSMEVSGETSANDTSENGEYKPVTMAFVGDTYFSDTLYNNYTKSGLNGFMGQSILDIFLQADIMIADHEYVATDLPEEAKDTIQLYNFKAPVAREVLWQELGVDIVTMANNHAMDYGEQSLLDSLDALEANDIACIGAGRNLDEALQAEIKIINGKKIAVLAACRFIPSWEWYAQENKPGVMTTYESTDRFGMVKDEITRLKEEEKCDIVVAYVHFGQERSYDILQNQKNIAHGYIDSGADLVIGSHAHNLQGIEIYKGAPIYYNLGNFLFGSYSSDTVVVNVEINEDNSISTKITPCVAKQYVVEEATGEKGQEIMDFVESISVNIEIDENGNVTEKVE